MEGKTMFKLSHVVAFLLVASLFQPLTARDLVFEVSDEIEVLRFPMAKENQVKTLDDISTLCPGKQSWPELVGKPAETAKKIIEKENPIAEVHFLFPDMPVKPGNYVCGRVFVVVNWNLIVQTTPTMG
ncbi:PREDICTED: proteinase inhibitor I-B-like [Nicotiana attenuata]|uniref:Proteinase inhibitor i-b n=1 Tax=Nicotiana attenuata TaxID=49451 RepID=A0A1J6IUS0_NICAT|nr:PREDICTED: proteinase inhibitor I-B-like [Nicotiana attenuata]OIS98880.1 proteinase inhibitor i-b [Nicotiana attenuata]